MAQLPTPSEGILLTHFIVSDDVERSRRFYTDVLGGEAVFQGDSSKGGAVNRRTGQRLGHDQRRRGADRRQADRHARRATGS